MLPKKAVVNFVQIDSSSDDEPAVVSARKVAVRAREGPAAGSSPRLDNQTMQSRSFWKAGDYAVASATNSTSIQDSLEHARVHPKFLHSNATSHKWAFGAIAELMDNAVDEIHKGATIVKIDKVNIMDDNSPALLFQDDGGGMDPDGIRKCMSLGYSSKKTSTTIGQYGNGFKTSTMRLGADVIVFSRAIHEGRATQSIGLLSYTFLRKTGQDDVIVPMIDYDISNHCAAPIIYSSHDDWSTNLDLILEWSPFESKECLIQQFDDIGSHGTKIIIYNLWLNDEGIYELAFDDDAEDIRLRDEANGGGAKKLRRKDMKIQSHISYRYRYSLRAYASMLYLRKFSNFKILLRGKLVEQYNIGDDLKYSKVVVYKPQAAIALQEVAVQTTIGFIKEAPNLPVAGFNIYHKNRLIRPFWKVTAEGSVKGNGVVGVLEANFIEPAHDKQDFERSTLYIRLETKLKQIVSDYWKNNCHLVGYQPPGASAHKVQKEHPIQPPSVGTDKQTLFGVGHSPVLGGGIRCNQPISGAATNGPFKAVTLIPVANRDSVSVDEIREENLQLFLRCEAHKQKSVELKEKIVKVEYDLNETRKRCAQLSAYVESKRNESNTGV